MTREVGQRPVTAEAQVQSHVSPWRDMWYTKCQCDRFFSQHFSFPLSISFHQTLHTHSFTYHPHYIMFLSQHFSFPCQYHSTSAPYPFIHLPPTLYNVSLPALQFSPVSIIPPVLHTHSFTYHPRYIMFLSQYFSIPCQYHSTNAPYPFIHLPPMLYNVSLPVLQYPLSVPFHQCSIPIHSPTTHAI